MVEKVVIAVAVPGLGEAYVLRDHNTPSGPVKLLNAGLIRIGVDRPQVRLYGPDAYFKKVRIIFYLSMSNPGHVLDNIAGFESNIDALCANARLLESHNVWVMEQIGENYWRCLGKSMDT
jgi:hypothetical protein